MTISPVPAPSRSATTTMLRVGSLSRSYGWTIKNLTPSRSGVFLVDQTVPTTLAKNIGLWPLAFGLWSLIFDLQIELASKPKDQRPKDQDHQIFANTSAGSPKSRAAGVMMVLAVM